MEIKFTREDLHLLAESLDSLKRENEQMIDDCYNVDWTEIIVRFREENKKISDLRDKITLIMFGRDE